ncbi:MULTISPECIES: MFS transporter [Sphingomonas]|jgi:MFS family permease|uniref:Sugar transport protein n=1 Tax=Sphingomonas aerolata TaxID=185951 RepID=A0A2T4YM98_9SPHN|nr:MULTISPECIES: MFS transporter [Sphingomonas]KHA64868.1 major facilitator transporter [Sphingomonas sp. Ant20]KQM91708.1 MFS transporter [Sphingomonas sp. Leaf226]MBD8470988.1 MFS transporter [Sphingomonas sp. CFBP 8765]MBD8638493.1 MFS transporter [Sphingomonas sp. CFBP 13733]MBD8700013.1 MFS transporter [Sphingomonas sp. CFBP 13714]
MATTTGDASPLGHVKQSQPLIIIASSLGAVFEWYDFYLYGLLATIITAQFFSGVNETTGFIFALAAFAAGFAVRPFGALVFGRIGDVVGRKNTFLVTMAIMGLSTFLVGLLPSYASVGVAAPIALVVLRLLQGLALGGEYGGAATYVAEHAPDKKRGLFTSFIQTTASLGLFAALLIVIGVRTLVGEEAFAAWGWRIPFIVSIALLAVSLWIRMQLEESPVFQKMKEEGKTSKAPLTEAFAKWGNLKIVLIALFGAVVGQGVVFYTSQFYALFFLEKNLRVDGPTTNILIAIALLIATPAFIFFGWLSDKVGRKWIILTGCALAALTYMPLFHALSKAANPALYAAQLSSPVSVVANPDECSVQFDPVGKNKFDSSSCDIAKSYLAKAGISYTNVVAPAGTVAQIHIGGATIPVVNPAIVTGADRTAAIKAFGAEVKTALTAVGYPEKADPAQINKPMVVAILVLLVLYVTMVYGPIAALLVELFPTRIRYTSMSLPYHIGNGWFGGFLPTAAFAMVAATGDIYYGLWYPILACAVTALVGLVFLPETFRRSLHG